MYLPQTGMSTTAVNVLDASAVVESGTGADPNNNSQVDKCYSLRPRTAVARRGEDDEEEEVPVPVWRQRKSNSGGGRRKQKPAPLSKYRRKTANARERSRMREINEAFDSLRRAVPGGGEPEKLTKITTLRLAMKYIAALSQVLSGEQPSHGANVLPMVHDSSDVESLLSDSTTQEMSISEHSLTPPLPPLSLLDGHISSEYSDFGDTSSLHLDPYADFSSFVLDDPFPADFS